MPKTEPFDQYADEYEDWFVVNKVQNVLVGYGTGSVVVIKAQKIVNDDVKSSSTY